MKKTLLAALVVAFVAAGCAEPDPSATDDTTTSTTTLAAEATTTQAPTTDDATETSTPQTTAETTTTEAMESAGADVVDAQAFISSLESAAQPQSARIQGAITMAGIDLPDGTTGDAEILFASAWDEQTGNGAFSMDMSSMMALAEDPGLAGSGFSPEDLAMMEMRQVGDTAYLRFGLFNLLLGAQTPWVSMPADEGVDFSQDLQTVPSDPGAVLETYDGADVSIELVGTETVNGVEADHYRLDFDLSSLAADLTADELAELEASGIFADGVMPVDVWVSTDGYLVRMTMTLDGTGIEAPPGEGFSAMTIAWDVLDIGESITIEVPPTSEVTAIEDLEGLFDLDSFDFGFGV